MTIIVIKIITFLCRCGALTGTVYTWKRLVVLSIKFIKCKKSNHPFEHVVSFSAFRGVASGGGGGFWGARDPPLVGLVLSKQPTIFR